jgi:uncharacterized phage protein gp47/JayE
MADTGFSRPTLADLIDRAEADINTRLPGADSRLRRSVLSVLARVNAGLTHGLYGFLDFIARQAIPDTAVAEYLERHAAIWGISRKSATYATGTVTFTGTSGSAVNVGTKLQRGDGVEYVTTEAVVLSGGTATASIEASSPGDTGNADTGTQLVFVSPIDGVNAVCITSAVSTGTDDETDDNLRTRLLERLQRPPHGGSYFDYIGWAKAVPGVTRVWVYPLELGAGTVTVRFMMDDTYTDGIPQAGDVATVQAYLDDESRRPVTADVTVVAPVAVALNFSILLKKADGTTETSPTIRAAVQAELKDMLFRDAEPGGKIHLSRIREAISVAAGEFDHNITAPSADVTYSAGQIAKLGTLTWL